MSDRMYANRAPNVHTHFLQDDELADAQGYSVTEFCCHACGLYETVYFTLIPKDSPLLNDVPKDGMPALVYLREKFIDKHISCVPALDKPPLLGDIMPQLRGNDQYKFLCPPFRKFTVAEKIHDLRGKDLTKVYEDL